MGFNIPSWVKVLLVKGDKGDKATISETPIDNGHKITFSYPDGESTSVDVHNATSGDYSGLINKPSINGNLLSGDKDGSELGLMFSKLCYIKKQIGSNFSNHAVTWTFGELSDLDIGTSLTLLRKVRILGVAVILPNGAIGQLVYYDNYHAADGLDIIDKIYIKNDVQSPNSDTPCIYVKFREDWDGSQSYLYIELLLGKQ